MMKLGFLRLRLPTFSQLKDAAAALLVGISSAVVVIGLYKASFSEAIGFEPLMVPSSFQDKGYTKEVSTTRLVDEIKKINQGATTTKSRSSVSGKAPGEELAKINSLPLPGGIDVKAIQDFIREMLGITTRSITGDITVVGKPDEQKFFVRIRMEPEGVLLVDGIFGGEPDAVLKFAALKIIENLDPVVAASYYRNNKNLDDAFRCIDLALTNGKPQDDTFALSQRAQIYLGQKKFELAKADLDELFKLDPNSPQGLGVQSYWYNEQKMFKEGMAYAERQKKVRPDMWHSYFNKADSLIGLGLDAESEMLEGLKHKPNKGWAYVDTAEYLMKKGKNDDALKILKVGAGRFPDSFEVNFSYGKKLWADGHTELALSYLRKAYALENKKKEVWPLLLEALPKAGHEDLRAELTAKMSAALQK